MMTAADGIIERGPMRAKAAGVELPPLDPAEWSMEPKIDGWRFFWHRTVNGVRSIAARNGSDHTGRPGLRDIELHLSDLLELGDLVDGELCAPADDRGSAAVSSLLAGSAGEGTLQAWLFDVLVYHGDDLTGPSGLNYIERRMILDRLVPSAISEEGNDALCVHVPYVQPDKQVFRKLIDGGIEGVVLKHLHSRYLPGKKSSQWPKVKPEKSAEALIIGFVPGNGRLEGKDGAFKLRMLDSGAETTCSTRSDMIRAELSRPGGKDAYFGHVCEIGFQEIMRSGKPRHPRFLRLRPDRDPKEAA